MGFGDVRFSASGPAAERVRRPVGEVREIWNLADRGTGAVRADSAGEPAHDVFAGLSDQFVEVVSDVGLGVGQVADEVAVGGAEAVGADLGGQVRFAAEAADG